MQQYTVHNIPFWLSPFFYLYGWIGGIGLYLLNATFRLFCRIEYAGKEHIDSTPNHIFCLWHENVPLYFIAHSKFRKPNIWLTFQLWYMKPTHIIKKIIGIQELAYGASGHDGKAALKKVIIRLREGWSTFLTPDGPKGPVKKAKDGVFVMSLKTGVPIIPVAFQLKTDWRLPSWDRKRYPPFFSKLVVIYGKPIVVTKANFEHSKTIITAAMEDVVGILDSEPIPPNV